MPYITLAEDHPGIISLIRYRPDSGMLIARLAELLMRGENSLARGERELIAAHVSALNECQFCASAHSAIAAEQLPGGSEYVGQVLARPVDADVSPKLRTLLAIAGAVNTSGRAVTAELVEQARQAGATDGEIHDTVLIAAMFSMANRYVDGLAAALPDDPEYYGLAAAAIVSEGYIKVTTGLDG